MIEGMAVVEWRLFSGRISEIKGSMFAYCSEIFWPRIPGSSNRKWWMRQ